jgi:hypothetical protein
LQLQHCLDSLEPFLPLLGAFLAPSSTRSQMRCESLSIRR